MLRYSLAKRKNTMTGTELVYATTQMNTKMSLTEFSKHISEHGSPYTRDTIVGVLTAAVDCLREQLLNGNKVELGDLGTFVASIKSKGVEKAEDFNPANDITSINVTWGKGSEMKNLLEDATFEFVTTRERQNAAKKAQKDEMDNGTTADKDTEPGEQTGGDGDDDDDRG